MNMLERYDETELLDLIEGELDQRAVAALQAKLAGDPHARKVIESLARDRATLRSLGEPALPMDFMKQIEPMLARPMLIDRVEPAAAMRPGEYRRQHRRANRRGRFSRLAVAAALLIVALGGAWAMVDGFILNTSSTVGDDSTRFVRESAVDGESHAPGSAQRDPMAASAGDDAALRSGLGPGVVHHDRPPLDMARLAAAPRTPRVDQPRSADRVADVNPVIAVDFALVLDGRHAATGEAALSRVVTDLGERGALVKNFSFAEAQKLAEQYRLAHGEPAPEAPMTASLAGAVFSKGDLYQLAQRVREQLRTNSGSGLNPNANIGDAALGAGTVIGDPSTRASAAAHDGPASDSTSIGGATMAGQAALAPTLEQQLDFSSRGAVYTIAVPASEIISVIERLSLSEGQSMMLEMLPPPPTIQDVLVGGDRANRIASSDGNRRGSTEAATSTTPPTLVWLTEGPRVRAAMSRLSQARDGAVALVPVIVR